MFEKHTFRNVKCFKNYDYISCLLHDLSYKKHSVHCYINLTAHFMLLPHYFTQQTSAARHWYIQNKFVNQLLTRYVHFIDHTPCRRAI